MSIPNPLVRCQKRTFPYAEDYLRCFLKDTLQEYRDEGYGLINCIEEWVRTPMFRMPTKQKEYGTNLGTLYLMYLERAEEELMGGSLEVCVRAVQRMKEVKREMRAFVGKLLKWRFGVEPEVHPTYYWTPREGRVPLPHEVLPTARKPMPKTPVRLPKTVKGSFAFPVLQRPVTCN